jgi:hypothetical protein
MGRPGRPPPPAAEFVAAWNAAAGLDALAAAVGMAPLEAQRLAGTLRRLGHALKRMPAVWPRQGSKAVEIILLGRRGAAVGDIAVRVGASVEFVRRVMARAAVEQPSVGRPR